MHVLQAVDYEVRTYHPTKWISTTVSGMHLDAAMNTGFRRLFNYIQGNNHNSEFKSVLLIKCHMEKLKITDKNKDNLIHQNVKTTQVTVKHY